MSRDDAHVLDGRTAGFVSRLFAFVVDLLVVAGIVAIGGWIAVLIDGVIEQIGLTLRVSLGGIYVVMIPLIIGSYFVMFWALTGRTIGKWVMGLRVVDLAGHPPTLSQSVIRIIGYGISAIVFWLGYLWVLVDDNRRAWHDHMARTWVVYDYARKRSGDSYEEFLAESPNT
jgi:uncharacterized RDD family membrane protein YckC